MRVDGGLTGDIGRVKLGQGRIGDSQRGEASGSGLKLGHDLEHFHQLDRAGLMHEDAAMGDMLHEAGAGKLLQRLADRGARDAETLCQAMLVKPVPLSRAATEDHLLKGGGNAVCAARIHAFVYIGIPFGCNENRIVYKMIGSQSMVTTLGAQAVWRGRAHSGRMNMKHTLMAAAAATALFALSGAASATELRLSHQWSNQDIRHQVAQMVVDDVAAADVDLEIKIFGSKSLFKPREQYKPLSRGQLDMTVFPLSYAGGQQPAFNLTLMPGLVKNHDHAARLNDSEFMAALEAKMADDDVMVLVHGYLAGGFVGKDKCITKPSDVEGLQTRAAGKAFEQMLAGAGASIASMASSEIYNAMQTGVLNAANTSSSSFVSYRIYEQVACYTPAADVALWFMYQPLLMNKSKFESLTEEQQAALMAAAEKAEAFYLEEAKKQDAASVEVFEAAGVEIASMTQEDFDAWRAIAMETSYASFVADVPDGQALLDMALSVD